MMYRLAIKHTEKYQPTTIIIIRQVGDAGMRGRQS